jgi:hypothetical protein
MLEKAEYQHATFIMSTATGFPTTEPAYILKVIDHQSFTAELILISLWLEKGILLVLFPMDQTIRSTYVSVVLIATSVSPCECMLILSRLPLLDQSPPSQASVDQRSRLRSSLALIEYSLILTRNLLA